MNAEDGAQMPLESCSFGGKIQRYFPGVENRERYFPGVKADRYAESLVLRNNESLECLFIWWFTCNVRAPVCIFCHFGHLVILVIWSLWSCGHFGSRSLKTRGHATLWCVVAWCHFHRNAAAPNGCSHGTRGCAHGTNGTSAWWKPNADGTHGPHGPSAHGTVCRWTRGA